MVLNRSSERVKTVKLSTMMEANTAEVMDRVSSPRVMNTHYPFR